MTWKATKFRKAVAAGQTLFVARRRKWKRDERMPSGWKHMCRAAGLRPAGYYTDKRAWRNWTSLRGNGRLWRVNASGTFDMSYPYADFDRWANSKAKTFPMPKNKTELELYVRFTNHDT